VPIWVIAVAFVAVVMPLVVWLAKPGRIPKLPQALSVVVALAGAFWLVERPFLPDVERPSML